MKAVGFVFILAVTFCIVDSKAKNSLTISAVLGVIASDFATESDKIDIISCVNQTFSEKWLDNFLRLKNNTLVVQLSTCNFKNIELNTSTLLIFESPEDFDETVEKIIWQTNPAIRDKHLVYIRNGSKDDLKKAIEDASWIDNVAFLLNETEDSIELASSFMFTASKCHENQLVTINRYQKDTRKWESNNFFPKKYRNMHGCPLKAVKAPGDNAFDIFERVLQEISKDLNFSTEWVITAPEKMFRYFRSKPFDFYKIIVQIEDGAFMHIFVDSEQGALFVPRGELLTPFEKLMSPFDLFTWVSIFLTLSLIFVSIQVTSFVSRHYRDAIFGRRIGSPSMNLVNIFFCGGQTQVPDTPIARFVFLNIIIWSLIIRTCFQSLSYRALQLDPRHPAPNTVDEMLQLGFMRFSGYGTVSDEHEYHK